MKLYTSFSGDAYLLGRDGTAISVLNHPSDSFEFESILDILNEYGDDTARRLVSRYELSPEDGLKAQILTIYDNTWCKVRDWEGRRLVTFRITSTDSFNWYNIIVNFLINHTEYRRSCVTVESDKRTGYNKLYWDEISYEDAISPVNEIIIATIYIKEI